MRQNEERVAAVRSRIRELERQKKRRRNFLLTGASVAACFVVIVALSFMMPSVMEQLGTSGYADYKMAASIFNNGAGLGYVVVGTIAFVLGVAVTLLCVRLHGLEQGQVNGEDRDDRTR